MRRIGVLALLATGVLAAELGAQGPDAGRGTRFGVSLGGIATFGVLVEWFDDARSIELAVGTWSFRDLGVSVVGKQYFGAGAAQPFVGGGLWAVTARPEAQQRGVALVARAPIGVDWGVVEDSSLGFVLNVNRAIYVRRTDPEDDLPMSERFVPLPELHFKYAR